jgi:alpha-D-ribose 1-methylphosphonate 5-triphosphate synthase subunit PhnG
MARKLKAAMWSMKRERELMALAKTNRLDAIADQMQRSPAFIMKRAARLGLSIKGRKVGIGR